MHSATAQPQDIGAVALRKLPVRGISCYLPVLVRLVDIYDQPIPLYPVATGLSWLNFFHKDVPGAPPVVEQDEIPGIK